MDIVSLEFKDILFVVIFPALYFLFGRGCKMEKELNDYKSNSSNELSDFKIAVAKEYASKEYLAKIEDKIDDLRRHNENYALKSDFDKLEVKIDEIRNYLMKGK